MEDKQYLDEAGLGEVGKVISKFYASKDDIKDLEGLKDFVASHNEIKLHYITHEEYQKMEDEDKLPQLSDIHDPIAIVAIGSPVDEFVAWGDDPWNALWDIGLVPEKVIGGRGHQKYIILNMTPNRKIIIDKVDDMDFNATPLKDSDVRLQLAFGERDHCVYWRLLANDTPDSHWSYIVDPYAKQGVENAQGAIYNLAQEMQGKMDKVDGKQLSTNDYTDEDKKKLDSIDVEAIKTNIQSSTQLPWHVCDVQKDILSKGKDAPNGLYWDSNAQPNAFKIYNVFNDYSNDNIKSYTVFQMSEHQPFMVQQFVWFEPRNSFFERGYPLSTRMISEFISKAFVATNIQTNDPSMVASSQLTHQLYVDKAPKINTVVVASYNSSDDSKQKADYIVQENECAIQKINEYMSKLPSFGGTILLTDGEFYAKTNSAINPKQNNITIKGCGSATHLIDKQDKRTLPFIGFTTNNCTVQDVRITFQYGHAIAITSAGCAVKNIYIDNRGNRASIYIQKSGRHTTVSDIVVNAPNGGLIESKGNTNVIERCNVLDGDNHLTRTSISGSNNVVNDCVSNTFVISGDRNRITRCIAYANEAGFDVSGRCNQLTMCHSVSNNSDGFVISSGFGHSLSNCQGATAGSANQAGFRLGSNSKKNILTGCISNAPAGGVGYAIEGHGNQLSSCTGEVDKQGESFSINGNFNSISNCFGQGGATGFSINGTDSKIVGFSLGVLNSDTKTGCIIKGTRHIVTNGNFLSYDIDNQGTNCVVNNNIFGKQPIEQPAHTTE